MKILIVGSNEPWAIERYFVRYLEQLGASVSTFTAPDIVFRWHSRNLLNKILFKTGVRTHYKPVNTELIRRAEAERPDVIWIWKGMEIYPRTLHQLRTRGFKLANFNPDHPFIITSAGSGNKNVTDSVGLYDLHFCYHRDLVREIRERFAIPAVFLPFAYEETDMRYEDPAGIKEIPRLCFQGNPDRYRAEMVSHLAGNGIPVDVYGHGWEKTAASGQKGISIFPIASRADFWKLNQACRVQLNLFREYNAGSHNMRTFEIPAAGGIELTEYSQEQAEFFRENEEIFFFRGKDELIAKARSLLSLDPAESSEIRSKARRRSVSGNYTFRDRSRTVFEAFEQLLS